MCGIFGWSFVKRARLPAAQREVLAATLAVSNSMRGDQSWGAHYLTRDGRTVTRREVGDIARVAGIGAQLGEQNLMMAHTRFATVGSVSKDNQHPFRAGEILLAHNGVVSNHTELNAKYSRQCSVDSQHFAHHLAEGRDFSDVEAYGSLEWIENSAPASINLLRMRKGSLAVYGIRDAKGKQVGTVWSSDMEHLRSAIGASRLDGFPYVQLEEGHVYVVAKGKLHEDPRRLACAAPSWDGWESLYRSTQGGARGGRFVTRREGKYIEGIREVRGFRRDNDTPRIVQLDSGLLWDEAAQRLIRSDEPRPYIMADADEEEETTLDPCERCGSLSGFDADGVCLECATPNERAMDRGLHEMTDDEWALYQYRTREGAN
jgi:hypothetical protein